MLIEVWVLNIRKLFDNEKGTFMVEDWKILSVMDFENNGFRYEKFSWPRGNLTESADNITLFIIY